MTKVELLSKYKGMAEHNLLCYSKNYAMTIPKDGHEDDFEECLQEIKLLETMITEAKQPKRKLRFQERLPSVGLIRTDTVYNS